MWPFPDPGNEGKVSNLLGPLAHYRHAFCAAATRSAQARIVPASTLRFDGDGMGRAKFQVAPHCKSGPFRGWVSLAREGISGAT